MAISTAITTLLSGATDSSYTKVCDITSYPDLGAEPNKLDTTDLSAKKMKTSILGLQETPDLTFEANYTKDAYEAIQTMADANVLRYFKLEFGEAGAEGAFTWQGKISVYATGAGVDEVRKMTITVSAETEIKMVTE